MVWYCLPHFSTLDIYPQNGTTNAVSDISNAAGWSVVDCVEGAAQQVIKLLCTGHNSTCEHVFQGGANHTIVRVPEEVRTHDL